MMIFKQYIHVFHFFLALVSEISRVDYYTLVSYSSFNEVELSFLS